MGDSSASYIHMVTQLVLKHFGPLWFLLILDDDDDFGAVYIQVQHLIEKCLIFRMTKEECMEALSKHANIKPVITSTG